MAACPELYDIQRLCGVLCRSCRFQSIIHFGGRRLPNKELITQERQKLMNISPPQMITIFGNESCVAVFMSSSGYLHMELAIRHRAFVFYCDLYLNKLPTQMNYQFLVYCGNSLLSLRGELCSVGCNGSTG